MTDAGSGRYLLKIRRLGVEVGKKEDRSRRDKTKLSRVLLPKRKPLARPNSGNKPLVHPSTIKDG